MTSLQEQQARALRDIIPLLLALIARTHQETLDAVAAGMPVEDTFDNKLGCMTSLQEQQARARGWGMREILCRYCGNPVEPSSNLESRTDYHEECKED